MQKSFVFKLFHSGKRFQKFRFRGSFYADTSVLVWMEAVSVTIKLPFQIYPAWCGRGLRQKSIVFKLFQSGKRFQKVPFSCIFLCGYKRTSVDGRRIRNSKVPFSNLSGIVWTGPE